MEQRLTCIGPQILVLRGDAHGEYLATNRVTCISGARTLCTWELDDGVSMSRDARGGGTCCVRSSGRQGRRRRNGGSEHFECWYARIRMSELGLLLIFVRSVKTSKRSGWVWGFGAFDPEHRARLRSVCLRS